MSAHLTAYSLSSAIRKTCKTLTVQVISQKLAAATAAEQTLLNISENNSWIREVYLLGDGVPLVQARAVAPHNTYKYFKLELDNLGDQLLGESLIYKLPHTRSPFEFFQVNGLQARRSMFDLSGYKLMICEIFLD